MTAELRGLIEEKCKGELVQKPPSLSYTQEQLLNGRPVLELSCVGAKIIYVTDDSSLFYVDGSRMTADEAHRWLDALASAGMSTELRQKARQRIAANKPHNFGDPDFETPDGAVVLDVIGHLQNGGTLTWSVSAYKWK